MAKDRAGYLLGKGSTLPDGFRAKNVELTWKEFQAQIQHIPQMLDVAVLNYTVAVAKRALVVFQHSFKEKRFYSGDGETWPALSDFTIKKRVRRGTWPGRCGMMQEYGVLADSLKLKSESGINYSNRPTSTLFQESVWTHPNQFGLSKYHKGFCYAGIHNNPEGHTYGNGFGGKITPRPVKKRQFMGFSTYIDQFEEQYIDRYLFHQIFNRGGGGLMQGAQWDLLMNIENSIGE